MVRVRLRAKVGARVRVRDRAEIGPAVRVGVRGQPLLGSRHERERKLEEEDVPLL